MRHSEENLIQQPCGFFQLQKKSEWKLLTERSLRDSQREASGNSSTSLRMVYNHVQCVEGMKSNNFITKFRLYRSKSSNCC